jgi:hypothetical protein
VAFIANTKEEKDFRFARVACGSLIGSGRDSRPFTRPEANDIAHSRSPVRGLALQKAANHLHKAKLG